MDWSVIAFKHWDESNDGVITVADFKLKGTVHTTLITTYYFLVRVARIASNLLPHLLGDFYFPKPN